MTTTTIQSAMRRDDAAIREVALSLGTSAGLTAAIIGMGLVAHARPYASPWVCWCLVAAGILGTHLAGRNVARGWLLLVCLQPMWIAYAISTDQYGFVVGAMAYGLGQLNGYLRTRRESARGKEQS